MANGVPRRGQWIDGGKWWNPSEVVNVPGKSEYQLYLADIVPVGELEHWWTWSESRYIRYGGKWTSRCSKWRNKQAGENRKLTRGRRTTSYSTVQLNPPVSNHVTKELLLSGQPMQRDYHYLAYHYLAYYLAGLGLLVHHPGKHIWAMRQGWALYMAWTESILRLITVRVIKMKGNYRLAKDWVVSA